MSDDTNPHRPYVLWSSKWHACRYVGAGYVGTLCGIEGDRDHLEGWITSRPTHELCGRCAAVLSAEDRS